MCNQIILLAMLTSINSFALNIKHPQKSLLVVKKTKYSTEWKRLFKDTDGSWVCSTNHNSYLPLDKRPMIIDQKLPDVTLDLQNDCIDKTYIKNDFKSASKPIGFCSRDVRTIHYNNMLSRACRDLL